MTYTVAARCPATGRFGIGIATYSIAVGQLCDGLQAGCGVAISQAFPRPSNNRFAINLLKAGFSARSAIDTLVRDDEHAQWRQICAIGNTGRPVVHTGDKARGWAGELVEDDFAVFGNVLAGSGVLQAMREGYQAGLQTSFAEALMRSLEAGRDGGGQAGADGPLAERSAALVIVNRLAAPDLSLRVDLHSVAVDELRRVYELHKQYEAYYRLRDTHPESGMPQERFQAMLDEAAQGGQRPRILQAQA